MRRSLHRLAHAVGMRLPVVGLGWAALGGEFTGAPEAQMVGELRAAVLVEHHPVRTARFVDEARDISEGENRAYKSDQSSTHANTPRMMAGMIADCDLGGVKDDSPARAIV